MKRVLSLALAFLFLSLPGVSLSQTDIFVRGAERRYPIALPRLCINQDSSAAAKVAQEIPDIIGRNLSLTGDFDVLNQNLYIESAGNCKAASGFAFSDWTIIGAEGLVKGAISESRGVITIRMYLHDVLKQQAVVAKEYTADVGDAKKIAHRFANEIIKFFTGRLGIFGSQIAFSGKVGRFKELYLIDMDGTNLQRLTNDKGLALYPSWSPRGNELVFTSYRNRTPDVFTVDTTSRQVRQITRDSGLELGSAFTRDARGVIVSKAKSGGASFRVLDRNGKTAGSFRRSPGAIDISPSWSPDFSELAFCSNRSGGPQIYVADPTGSKVRRVSYVRSNYCTSPSWSPDGSRIAYVCRIEGRFQIFTSRPDGKDAVQLTASGNNEDPSWSPDGKFLTYATTKGRFGGFDLAIMKADGSWTTLLTSSPRISEMDPSWSPITSLG